jgi:hypothetical protein
VIAQAAVTTFGNRLKAALMIFVFTAVTLFFAFFFWTIYRLNRMSRANIA